jgi:hypothetical protein
VAQHVRGRLPNGERQGRLDRGGQRVAGAHRDLDTRRCQGVTRSFDLASHAGAAQAQHRGAGLLQRLAGHRLDVSHLALGGRRVPPQQLAGQLALQGDHRQVAAEQIVKIARQAEALLADGQRGDLIARRLQFPDQLHQPARR